MLNLELSDEEEEEALPDSPTASLQHRVTSQVKDNQGQI